MFERLGVRLRKLFRSDAGRSDERAKAATVIEQHAHAPGATQIGHVVDKRELTQHAHGSGGIQFGQVGSVHVIHAAAGHDVEFQAQQVQVMRLLDGSGDRRPAIEAFMHREFQTDRVTHLTLQQLVRVQRYCEVVEGRRGRRPNKGSAKEGRPSP